MGFYRLIRMIFKDILFKIPKKYLVIIIMILLIFIFKGSVHAVSADPENVEIHEWVDITSYYNNNRIDTQIIPTSNSNLYLTARLSLSNKSWVNILQCGSSFAFYSGGATSSDTKYMNCEINRNVIPGTISFQNDSKSTFAFLFQDDNVVEINGVEMTRYPGVLMNNTTNHLFIQHNDPGATRFYFYELQNEYNVDGSRLNYIVPGVYNNQKILYDLITHEIVTTLSNDVAIGGVIENPIPSTPDTPDTPDTPEEPTTPDYSEDFTQVNENLDNINNSISETNENLEDVNNSINDTNDFLKDKNVTTNTDINVPEVENSQVISQIDSSYTDFFNDYIFLVGSETPVSVQLFIPNMKDGSILSTINISSDFIKTHLNDAKIFGTNYSILEIIYFVWYALFGFWFLGFGTKLVTILYSGEIMKDKGLNSLTNTYTGISKNML